MSRRKNSVTRQVRIIRVEAKPEPEELAEDLTEAAILHEKLGSQWVDEAARAGVVNRKSGFQLPTLFLFFLAFFTQGRNRSIKSFCSRMTKPAGTLLARFGGFDRFPTQASVSRFLEPISLPLVHAMCFRWLVGSHALARELLCHNLSACGDTYGGLWQLFDLDPTSLAVRHRHLDDDPSRPPAIRTSEALAGPGYMGRKRGEVIMRRGMLQHVGSGLWLGAWFRAGGSGTRELFSQAVEVILECCRFAGFAPRRAIVRVDGEGGGVPYLSMYLEAGLRFIVRSTHYSILDRLDLPKLIAQGAWFWVDADREAIDLGVHVLKAGAATKTQDNETYAPINSRVVLTRMLASARDGAGIIRDGYRYELIATNLEPDEWPAAEVAKAYFHRSTIENRLAQEDRDLGLDTVFSYELGGQALVTVIGLLVWNLRIIRGFDLAREELEAEGPPRYLPREARAVRRESPQQPVEAVDKAAKVERQSDMVTGDDPSVEDSEDVDDSLASEPVETPEEVELETVRVFESVVQDRRLPETLSWTGEGLKCANGVLLPLVHVRMIGDQAYAGFKAPPGPCPTCPKRTDCSRSTKLIFRKEVNVAVKCPDAIEDLLRRRRDAVLAASRKTPPVVRTSESAVPRSTGAPAMTEEPFAPQEPPPGGPHEIALTMLNPRALMQRFSEAVAALAIRVRCQIQPASKPKRRYTYEDDEARSRKRHRWDCRLRYNRQESLARVDIFCGPSANALFAAA